MSKSKIIKNFKDLASKYKFNIIEGETIEGLEYVALQAINTDNNFIDWIKCCVATDQVQLIGNTDNCNIWFCDTRKDFTPKIISDFVAELNIVFNLKKDGFTIKELVDPEDWQVLANVNDAYEDNRYFKAKQKQRFILRKVKVE